MDFDNIVIEDEDDCLKRLKELNRKVHQYAKSKSKGYEKWPESESTHYDMGKSSLTVTDEVPKFTEEVACEILEFIKNIKTAETRGDKRLRYYFSLERMGMERQKVARLSFTEGTKGSWRIFITDELEGWLSGLV